MKARQFVLQKNVFFARIYDVIVVVVVYVYVVSSGNTFIGHVNVIDVSVYVIMKAFVTFSASPLARVLVFVSLRAFLS